MLNYNCITIIVAVIGWTLCDAFHPGDFENFFSILGPKSLESHLGKNKEVGETEMPLLIDISPHGMIERQTREIKHPKDKGIEVLIDLVGSMDGSPLIKKNKPNEKVLMSFSEMYIPFQSEIMKSLSMPDFSHSFHGIVPFLMPDISLSHRYQKSIPIKRNILHKKKITPIESLTKSNFTNFDPFEKMFSLFSQGLKNLTGSFEQDDLNLFEEVTSNGLISRIVSDDRTELAKREAIHSKYNDHMKNPKSLSEMKMDMKLHRDDGFKYLPGYNLGYLTIVAPILAGLLSTIIGIEIVRRNRDKVCKKCPFSPYNQIEHC